MSSFDVAWYAPGVIWVRWHLVLERDALARQIARHDDMITAWGDRPYVSLQEIDAGTPEFSAAALRDIASWLGREKRGTHRTLRGVAFVADNTVVRGFITAIGWATSTPYPQRTFDARDDAVDWLGEQLANA